MQSYFERDRETIFRSVELLIYVFDIESDCPEKDFDHFAGVLEAMEENSPDARIFVLVHKMDLVAEEERELILEDRKRLIEESCLSVGVANFQCFGTSIWDETLYKAWSEIVTNLIPNIGVLESHLSDFCRICDADEVVLFERATFLVISHAQASKDKDDRRQQMLSSGEEKDTHEDTGHVEEKPAPNKDKQQDGQIMSTSPHSASSAPMNDPSLVGTPASPGGNATLSTNPSNANNQQLAAKASNQITTPQFDAHRFEKISNIVKQFKLSCGKAQSQFQGMDVCNSKFTAFIDAFTANTYIMVIVSKTGQNGQDWGHGTQKAATLLNIQKARSHFEPIV